MGPRARREELDREPFPLVVSLELNFEDCTAKYPADLFWILWPFIATEFPRFVLNTIVKASFSSLVWPEFRKSSVIFWFKKEIFDKLGPRWPAKIIRR